MTWTTTDPASDPGWEHQQKCMETLNKSSPIESGKFLNKSIYDKLIIGLVGAINWKT